MRIRCNRPALHRIILSDKHNGEDEFIRLIQRVEHLVARHRDGARPLHAPLHLDVSCPRQPTIESRGVGRQVPAALLRRDVHHTTPTRFLGDTNCAHREFFDSATRGRVLRERIAGDGFAAKLIQKTERDHESPPH